MTAAEIIQKYDDSRVNQISGDQKLKWLKAMDQMLMAETVLTHELPEKLQDVDLDTYFDSWGMNSQMLIDEPWDELYIHYLDNKAAWMQNDSKRYNSTTVLYDNFLLSYKGWYNRNYRPLRERERWERHEWI